MPDVDELYTENAQYVERKASPGAFFIIPIIMGIVGCLLLTYPIPAFISAVCYCVWASYPGEAKCQK